MQLLYMQTHRRHFDMQYIKVVVQCVHHLGCYASRFLLLHTYFGATDRRHPSAVSAPPILIERRQKMPRLDY